MSIFGGESMRMESCLKNKSNLREAFVYEAMSRLPKNKLKNFAKSQEAKFMLESGIICDDTLERLVTGAEFGREVEIACCQLAMDADDPRWSEVVGLKVKLRDLMQDIVDDYKETGSKLAENSKMDFIDKSIPKEYRP